MTVLHNGKCERVKACVHGVALGTAAVCAAYNIAAWLVRRRPHLAVNAVIYSAAVIWEYVHVQHHLASMPDARPESVRRAPRNSAA